MRHVAKKGGFFLGHKPRLACSRFIRCRAKNVSRSSSSLAAYRTHPTASRAVDTARRIFGRISCRSLLRNRARYASQSAGNAMAGQVSISSISTCKPVRQSITEHMVHRRMAGQIGQPQFRPPLSRVRQQVVSQRPPDCLLVAWGDEQVEMVTQVEVTNKRQARWSSSLYGQASGSDTLERAIVSTHGQQMRLAVAPKCCHQFSSNAG